MIHDLFLSLLNPYTERLPIEDFLETSDLSPFIHPQEREILMNILDVIFLHREIISFVKLYGSNRVDLLDKTLKTDEPLQRGLYLKALANALEVILESYVYEIETLEKKYLQNPSAGLIYIFKLVNSYEPLFKFLQGTLKSIELQKLHGCVLIQYLHRHSLHGDKRIEQALKQILRMVNIVFLKQLTDWILYAKINDIYGEFFIQAVDSRHNGRNFFTDNKCSSSGSGKLKTFSTGSVSSTDGSCSDIWKYEICYGMLPNYLSSSWAEKVLFIGQTVLMFTGFKKKTNLKKKSDFLLRSEFTEKSQNNEISLWSGQEHIFSMQIQKLNETGINVANYEKFVDGVKTYLSGRLSEISFNQADLVHQLKLVKDFYMMGRGELYLEFIKRTNNMSQSKISENFVRDIIKAFESSALSVGVVDELDKFKLVMPKQLYTNEDSSEISYIQQITLNYKISWPLQLLFSPAILDKYNQIFRFLLQIKQTQYELDMTWCKQREEYKVDKNDSNISISISLRNQLMFFIHNLQYYIQVDVVESQYSILMNVIQSTNDFEELTRAHNVFQTNILSLCFLIKADDTRKSVTTGAKNVIIFIFNDIFNLCSDFCTLLKYTADTDVLKTEINLLQMKFKKLIEQLINILVGYKLASHLTRAPLSQLLLRLDFNNWFSNGKQEINS